MTSLVFVFSPLQGTVVGTSLGGKIAMLQHIHGALLWSSSTPWICLCDPFSLWWSASFGPFDHLSFLSDKHRRIDVYVLGMVSRSFIILSAAVKH